MKNYSGYFSRAISLIEGEPERFTSLGAAALAGFAGAVAQVLILRELLVFFYGNELSTGLIFACWLLWTALGSGLAGKLAARIPRNTSAIFFCLLELALTLPLTLLWIRASRIVWSVPAGELIGPGLMLVICLSSTSLFCLSSGFFFALAWSVHSGGRSDRGGGRSVLIYLGEALGAAAGGICFYFVFLPHIPALFSAFTVSILLFAAALLMEGRKHVSLRLSLLVTLLVSSIALSGLYALGPALERLSRHWQWGSDPLCVRDTPYNNLSLFEKSGQFTLFANGLWLFSVPDPQTAEYAVHTALLQHPRPRSVLLLGGGVSGLLSEILKHPSIEAVDYVEPDPQVIRLAEDFLPASVTSSIHDPKVRVFNDDAASFIRSNPGTYDIVLLNAGDPLNAELNRFYTVEFYERVRKLLNKGAIFAFGVSSSSDILGTAQARFLRSIYLTLRSVFPYVAVYPGDSARFFASETPGSLVLDPQKVVERIFERKLELSYYREYYIFDYLSPFRLAYIDSVLAQGRPMALNRDFSPGCYFSNLVVWSAQLHPLLEKALTTLFEADRSWFWASLSGLILVLLLFVFIRSPAPGFSVSLSVLVMGGAQMTLEIVLILAFQILVGFVYTELALIIALFMAGIALGAAGIERLSAGIVRPRLFLASVQALFCIYVGGVLKLIYLLQAASQSLVPLPLIFSVLALVSGIFGGAHFSLAVKTLPAPEGFQPGAPESLFAALNTGPTLYALDLAGAAAGALGSSLIVLPLYGLSATMVSMVLLLSASLVTLKK